MKTILLFNTTGQQGTAIANRLLSKGYELLTPVRNANHIPQLAQRGIQAHLNDFSTESLQTIVQKADQVVLQIPAQISPSLMITLAENALRAIKVAGSPPTVFVISSTVPLQKVGKASPDARLLMQQKAQDLLPNAVILSATEYFENFSTAYRSAIEEQHMIPQTIPAHLPVNYLSWADLATYVTAVLEHTSLEGGFYPIGGKEGINGIQLAQRLGTLLQKQLTYHPLTHQELNHFLSPILGTTLAAELTEFYEWQDTEGQALLNPDTHELRQTLGIQLPSFEDWAKEAFLIPPTT
ncbi:MAG: NmrA family NAD(P)-binding protein [Bacteroidota bacterium]